MRQLRALLLSNEKTTLVCLQRALQISGVITEIHRELKSALAATAQRHFDSIIIDCESIPSGNTLPATIRAGRSNKSSPVVALVMGAVGESADSACDIQQTSQAEANVVLHKPITMSRLVPQLNIILLLMTREHLRYLRHPIRTCAVLSHEERTIDARTVNISHDGLAVTLIEPVALSKHVKVRFALPTEPPVAITAAAEVSWSDNQGRVGLHLDSISSASRPAFEQALAELNGRAAPELVRYCIQN